MHSQNYSGLSLIFAILRNFRVAGAQGSMGARLLRPPGKLNILHNKGGTELASPEHV